MRRHRLHLASPCLSLLASLLLAGTTLFAQNNPLITLREDGVGFLDFPQNSTILLSGMLLPDPGPGGLGSALTFDLLNPPSLVAGDLRVSDPGSGLLSDVVRFNPASDLRNESVVFYSNLGEGQLADTGFPTAFYTNIVSLVENDLGEVTYTPTAGQPGFVTGFGVTYHVISAPVNVPDTGTTVLLFGVAMAFLFVAQRALNRQVATAAIRRRR